MKFDGEYIVYNGINGVVDEDYCLIEELELGIFELE